MLITSLMPQVSAHVVSSRRCVNALSLLTIYASSAAFQLPPESVKSSTSSSRLTKLEQTKRDCERTFHEQRYVL